MASGCDFANHDLRVGIPRAHKQSIEDLVHPDFPHVLEAEVGRPVSDHAPAIEQDDAYHDGVEHGLRGEHEAPLDPPKAVNANCLGGYTDNEDVRECQRVISNERILQCRDDGDCRVKRISEQKVADKIN